jgi:MFS family permease
MARYAPRAADYGGFSRPVPAPRSGRSRTRSNPKGASPPSGTVVETDIPDRLDSLPFSRFHLLVIVALGITWVLDGLEVTLAGSLSGELMLRSGLGLSGAQIGLAGSAYLCGAVLGAFGFSWLTDSLGRKKLFSITLAVYLLATAATGLSWNVWSFVLFRFLTGAGIGGEYTAINSTIQELIPARLRSWIDLLINGSFWIGAAMGAAASIVLLNPAFIDPALGWRLAFLIGTTTGLVILVMRRWIPESPRWPMTHGFLKEAEAVVRRIEARIPRGGRVDMREQPRARLPMRDHTPLREVRGVLFGTYRQRTLASSAYLTVSEIFPLEIRALAIAFFYAVGTGVGGVAGPLLLGTLISGGSRGSVAIGYFIGALLMIVAAGAEALWGIAAERKPLEVVARPLSFIES